MLSLTASDLISRDLDQFAFAGKGDRFADGRNLCTIQRYALALKTLCGTPPQSGAKEAVDMVLIELGHGVALAVAMVGVRIRDDLYRIGFGIIQREIRRGAEVPTDRIMVEIGAVAGNAY
jgi:hypothetical protein